MPYTNVYKVVFMGSLPKKTSYIYPTESDAIITNTIKFNMLKNIANVELFTIFPISFSS